MARSNLEIRDNPQSIEKWKKRLIFLFSVSVKCCSVLEVFTLTSIGKAPFTSHQIKCNGIRSLCQTFVLYFQGLKRKVPTKLRLVYFWHPPRLTWRLNSIHRSRLLTASVTSGLCYGSHSFREHRLNLKWKSSSFLRFFRTMHGCSFAFWLLEIHINMQCFRKFLNRN